ncbi:hypothetical protein P5673_000654 [Acropora cervicornis]|uniref:Uncharacterized protein n=1 Tax=Acropora cervicornis TaxID=6130 RepID=A0AAD9R7H9_ACRCE|nr:hypothetical protein P5673_000654 [Acropora cervicornis]
MSKMFINTLLFCDYPFSFFLYSLGKSAICIEQTAARNLFFASRGGHFQRRSVHPCDRIRQSCSDVDCSGSCEQRSLECYDNVCGIADASPFRKKRSVPSA